MSVDERRELLTWTITHEREAMRLHGHDPHPIVQDPVDPWHRYVTCRRCGSQAHATSQLDRVVLLAASDACRR